MIFSEDKSRNLFIVVSILFFVLSVILLILYLNKGSNAKNKILCESFEGTYVIRVNSTASIPYAYFVKNESFVGYFYPLNFETDLSDLDGKSFRIAK